MFATKPFKTPKTHAALFQHRLRGLLYFFLFLCCIIIFRLSWLQIIQCKTFKTLSLRNQRTIIPLPPPRGIIVDRNGIVLAKNIPVYSLEITPEHIHNMEELLTRLKNLLPTITTEDIQQFKKTLRQNRAYVPTPLKLKLSQEEVALFASHQYEFPGVSVHARLIRNYPYEAFTSHVLGYVSRINLEELQKVNAVNYRGTNFIGKSGIEKYYEADLHGTVGYQKLETDVSGRTVRILDKENPVPGKKLRLTLDIALQKTAYTALEGKRGAVVAINPQNGEILALVSAPGFNPNHFVQGIRAQEYQELTRDRAQPLYNRAIRGLYPPASTMKPYVALAGLEYHIIHPEYAISDPGWYRIPGMKHAYRDWKKSGHGIVDVRRAIMVSCDTYFYQLGQRMGIVPMYQFLSQFGFGKLTGVDLPDESPGILPNPAWKKTRKKMPWYPGDTVISAIGQGFTLASPLQIAQAVATLSQRGTRHTPHLLLSHNSHHKTKKSQKPVALQHSDNWDIVMQGMRAVITNNEGTGYRFGRNAPYPVAAKTGTAQVFSGHQYDKKRQEDIPEYLRDHSLFIAFAPSDHPEIAVAVIVENDVIASHVARLVMDYYFTQHPREQK